MILCSCGQKIVFEQYDNLSKDHMMLLDDKERTFSCCIDACKDPNNPSLCELEEIILLLLFSLTDKVSNLNFNSDEDQDHNDIPEDFTNNPIYKETEKSLYDMGFNVKPFIHKLSELQAQRSINKKINEVFSWGDCIRKEEKWRKRDHITEIASIGALGGFSVLAAATVPPLAVVSLGLAFSIGGITYAKATPGGLVSIVAGCLQQRLALATHKVEIDEYYPVKYY